MSKVVIQGNASGTGNFTIAAPNSNTDRTFNLPDAAGTVLTTGNQSDFPAGSVLQVVQTVKTDTYSMSSTTWTDITGLSLSITPTSTSSKILVFYNLSMSSNAGVYSGMVKLVRDTTDIFLGAEDGIKTRASSGTFSDTYGHPMRSQNNMYLDSPSTTSAITYKMQMRSGYSGFSVYIGRAYSESDTATSSRVPSTITAMEIAA